MKKYIIPFLLVCLVTAVVVSGCFLQNPFQKVERFLEEEIEDIEVTGSGPAEENSLPPDVIADVPRESTGSFKYETMLPVRLVVDADFYTDQFELLSTTAPGVLVRVEDGKGNPVFSGITNDYGVLDKEVRLPGAPEDMTLSLHAEGYKSRTVVIRDMVEHAEINRTMGLVSKGVQSRDIHGLEDRDGDGIPDVYDAYPDDINSAFAYKVPAQGDLTVAYEDLFGRAQAGDADYNDFIARYNIEESSSEEGITKIHVDVTAAVKLAGYNHTFGIRINKLEAPAKLTRNYVDENGNEASFTQLIKEPLDPDTGPQPLEIVLFEHTGRALSTGNTQADFTLEFVIDGVIDNPQDPEVLSRPPYNPYLYVHNTGHDVHLIDEEPLEDSINKEDNFGNPETFRDADGFPWGLLVPPGPPEEDGWDPPLETQRIEVPYPRFTRWRESGGELSPDWYLHNDPWEPESAVYVAGYYNNGANDVAVYWKDGVETILTDGTENARATDIFAYNGDVYVSGYEGPKGAEIACYWKNGLKALGFTSGLEDRGEAQAMWADSGGVYVTGFYRTGTKETVWYWDGSEHILLSDNNDASLPALFVKGGDVYTAGYYDSGSLPYVAGYWVNGTGHQTYSTYSHGYDMFVSDSDGIYIAGDYWNSGSASMVACYWVNGTFAKTDLYTAAESRATSIFVSSGVVYSAGYFGAAGSETACYWEGTVKTDLDDGSPVNARAYDIYVASDSVYVSGYYYNGQKRVPCFWKDGVKEDLSVAEQSAENAEAVSIFVN